MKVYFNTKTFDRLVEGNSLNVTTSPEEAILLVLGAKKVDYSRFVNLKSVYRFGIGSENIDFKFLKKRDIPVYFPSQKAKNILYDSTANFTVYGIMRLLYQDAFGDVDNWKKRQRDYIGHKTALIVGLGNIGSRVADKLKLFTKVTTYDVLHNKEYELKPLVKEADIITIHIPLNDNTRHFFDAEKLSWVKDDAIIINTARGDLFDEDALYEKLKHTSCRAFFDVFWEEPYKGKLKTLGNEKFLMSPHSASNTKEFINEAFGDILEIIEGRFNNG